MIPISGSTGFKFSWYSTGALYDSLRAALSADRNRDAWRERMIRGMKKDFSWAVSAAAYSSLYGNSWASSESHAGESNMHKIGSVSRTMGKFTVEITDTNFDQEVAASEVPVLLDFWANGAALAA